MLRSALAIAIGLFSSAAIFSQDESQYRAWMKSNPADMATLRMAIAAKDNAAIDAMSSKLAATFDEVTIYWQKRNAPDAVNFARTAREAAEAIGAATTTADRNANLMKLQAQCGACHMAHRGGTAPNFTIE